MTEKKRMTLSDAQRAYFALQTEFSLAASANDLKKMREILGQTIEFPGVKTMSIRIDELGNQDANAALHRAALSDAPDAASFLLDRGAKVDVLNNSKRTPLHMAGLSRKSGLTAAILIDKGADLMARDTAHKTPLHVAAIGDSVEVAKVLLDRGADIFARDMNDDEPLHTAARLGKLECLKLFFERGGYDADDKIESRFKARGLSEQHTNKATADYLDMKEIEIAQRRKYAEEAIVKARHQQNMDALDKITRRRPKP